MGDSIISSGASEAGPGSVRPQEGWLCQCGQRWRWGWGGEGGRPRWRHCQECEQSNYTFTRGGRPLSCNTEVFKTQDTQKRRLLFIKLLRLGFLFQTRQGIAKFSLCCGRSGKRGYTLHSPCGKGDG